MLYIPATWDVLQNVLIKMLECFLKFILRICWRNEFIARLHLGVCWHSCSLYSTFWSLVFFFFISVTFKNGLIAIQLTSCGLVKTRLVQLCVSENKTCSLWRIDTHMLIKCKCLLCAECGFYDTEKDISFWLMFRTVLV